MSCVSSSFDLPRRERTKVRMMAMRRSESAATPPIEMPAMAPAEMCELLFLVNVVLFVPFTPFMPAVGIASVDVFSATAGTEDEGAAGKPVGRAKPLT
jgi:hypothetical protein